MAKKRRSQNAGFNPAAQPEALESVHPVPIPAAVASADQKTQASAPLARVWRQIQEFSAVAGDATFLWPRWLVLRAVGIVYIFIFAGIVAESRTLIGPAGVAPLTTYLSEIKQLYPGAIEAFLGAPSLFWLNSGPGMIAALGWVGLAAAIALVLNLWPRAALGVCWLVFLSFVTTWADFSSAQLDRLMLETALLCLPFAPPGMRPGLGAASPPRPIAVFMVRWLLFRVMFESGVVKLISPDPHWRNLTAMDVMYETAPSPTILGYWAHQLPHAYHIFEVAFTFLAELVAPLLAVFGGRRGRWFALAVWTALQAGIQLTCNFGWLNTAAIGLGLLLLDDQMLAAAAAKLRLGALGRFLASKAIPLPARAVSAWRLHGLRAALGVHFLLTIFYFAKVCGLPVDTDPTAMAAPVKLFAEFRSANGYFLYAYFDSGHYQVDFEGSNDGGKTWRTYEYRSVPQRVEGPLPFLAPWFPRFEATIQIESWSPGKYSVLPFVAAHLIARNPDVMSRFARDPFPDRAPTVVRMRRYRLAFTNPATLRRTGHYWRKEFAGDYLPAMHVTEQGGIAQFNLEAADAALNAGNYSSAFAAYERQFQLGNLDAGYRLADMYSRGLGVREQPEKTFALFSDLAERGELRAQHNLGLCSEFGVGVPVDFLKAAERYRRAADRGSLLSIYALGTLSAKDLLVPRADVEGLAMLLRAAEATVGDAALLARIRAEQPAQAKHLMERMSPSEIAQARALATARP